MVVLDQMKIEIQNLRGTLDEVTASLDLNTKKKIIEELSREMEEPGFWDDAEKANKKTKDLKNMQDLVEGIEKLNNQYGDIIDLIDMQNAEGVDDDDMAAEIRAELDDFETTLENIRISNLLNQPYDKYDVILRLNAGAGGTEACDWASMLYRMYTRWAERKGFTTEVLDLLDGDEAGIKSVTFQISGTNAYGLLKSEHGVHRLVRISPFNAQAKRQTSFVSCDVMPDIEEDVFIDTLEKDKAMQMLKAKLFIMKQEENQAKLDGIRGEVKDNAWGSQIRSYVLQPYTMVNDTRTGFKASNADGVLDGELDPFINAYLKWLATGGKPVGDTSEE